MAIALIQQKTNTGAAITTLVVTLDATPTAGDTLIACVGGNYDIPSTISGGGATWTKIDSSSSKVPNSIWVGPNASGDAGLTAITLTFVHSAKYSANISEWSGLQAAPTDTHGHATGAANTTAASPAITPSVVNSLVVAACSDYVALGASTGGFTNLTGTTQSGENLAAAYLIRTSAAATSTTWGTVTSGWDANISAFKGATIVAVPPNFLPFFWV